MKQYTYDIEFLIDIIKGYDLFLHKLTFRYGIDYIKCDPYLKEKYPRIFEHLENYFIPRKVVFIYESNKNTIYSIKTTLEVGNKYELETMIGVPKASIIPINETESEIKDLKWTLLENLSENDINEYKNKLKMLLVFVNYDWLNETNFKELIKLIPSPKLTFTEFINNIFSNNFDNIGLVYNTTILSLEDRFILADKFNPEIKKDCVNTIEAFNSEEISNWLDTLCIIPRNLLKISYNGDEYKIYI